MKKRIKPGIYRLKLKDSDGKNYEPKKPFETYRTELLHGKKVRVWECFETVEEAKKWRGKGGNDISPSMTYRDLLAHFDAYSVSKKEVSTQNKIRSQAKHLDWLMDKEVKKTTPFMVDELIAHWRSPEYLEPIKGTRTSFKNELTLLKALHSFYRSRFDFSFGHPVLKEHMKASVFRKAAKKPKKDLSVRQVGAFLTELDKITRDTEFEAVSVIAQVQYALYARIQEVAALSYEDFDAKTGWISINKKVIWPRFKGQKAFVQQGLKASEEKRLRSAYAAKLLQEWAMQRKIRSGPLFFLGAMPMPYRAIQFRYDRAFENAGLAQRGTHIIRHAALTEHYATSRDIYETMRAAGHSDLTNTIIYAKHRDEDLEKTQALIDSKLEGMRPVGELLESKTVGV